MHGNAQRELETGGGSAFGRATRHFHAQRAEASSALTGSGWSRKVDAWEVVGDRAGARMGAREAISGISALTKLHQRQGPEYIEEAAGVSFPNERAWREFVTRQVVLDGDRLIRRDGGECECG
eukprot:766428-Hanusia_phi.AAC.18